MKIYIKLFIITLFIPRVLLAQYPIEKERIIPCLIENQSDVMFLNLGRSSLPFKHGLFYPDLDKVILSDGTEIESYYKKELKVPFYKPLNVSGWKSAPTGWCSWYYYFSKITANEVVRNVEWLSENLKDYGVDVIQIDDGWQEMIGKGDGFKPSDWDHAIKEKFPLGMKDLAKKISAHGFTPGIWLSAQGHSDPEILKKYPKAFIKNPDTGYEVSGFWGRYLIDPTSEQAHQYLRDMFSRMNEDGYGYYKVDGQPHVLEQYIKQQPYFQKDIDAIDGFRSTLKTMKEAIGEDRYFLGCWGTPEEGIGHFDGARTGGDIGYNGNWYEVALRAVVKYQHFNNIVWHSDPDVLLVREPTPINHARLWASFMAMSGQSFLLSDRMYDLSPERVRILKKTLPSTPIMPVELFSQTKLKNIWNLKIRHLDEDYDVLGVYNFVNKEDYSKLLRWDEIGLDSDKQYHVFDFWEGKYLGAWEGGYYVHVKPESVQILCLREVTDGPKLVSTSRHITQGYLDLKELTTNANIITGTSKVVGGDPYSLYFAFPPQQTYDINKVSCQADYKIVNHGNWSEVIIYPDNTTELTWSCSFVKSNIDPLLVKQQEGEIIGVAVNSTQVRFRWYQSPPQAGHLAYLDGKLLGFTPESEILLEIDDHETHTLELQTTGWQNNPIEGKKTLEFRLFDLLPNNVALTSMKAEREYLEGPGALGRRFFLYRKNHRLEYARPEAELQMDGTTYLNGIAAHSNCDFVYPLNGCFSEFTAVIGLDDMSSNGSVIYKVIGDGHELFVSELITEDSKARPIRVDVSGIQELQLQVLDGGDGIDDDLANWCDAYLKKAVAAPLNQTQ